MASIVWHMIVHVYLVIVHVPDPRLTNSFRDFPAWQLTRTIRSKASRYGEAGYLGVVAMKERKEKVNKSAVRFCQK